MFRTIWVAIAILAFAWASQTATVKDTNCPKGCSCDVQSMKSLMSCKTLSLENEIVKIPVTHFEIVQSEHPLTMTDRIFANLGLKHVNSIIISNSSVVSIEKLAFTELQELTYLKIANSNISSLHPDIFRNNSNLKKLNLAGNPLDIDSFVGSASIEELDLSHCNISKLGQNTFQHLSQVTYLNLSDNSIESITPETFSNLVNVQEMHLAHNKLREVPKTAFANNKKLYVLDLSNNPIVKFAGEKLHALQELNLGSCSIRHIDAVMFKNMSYLDNLDLRNNQITDIQTKAFAQLTRLSAINLSGNNLRVLDSNLFANNPSLQKIVLDNNVHLAELPVHGFKIRGGSFNVYHFSCNNCGLRSLSAETFKNMPALVTLLLSHNRISDVSTGVFQHNAALVVLNLSFNDIRTIDDKTFRNNTDLNKLTLSGNPLEALHASMFRNNENLEYLDLSQCGLFKLWSLPQKLEAILSLNVSNNKLNLITQDDIAVTNKLKTLDISNNPLSCTDGFKSLILYLHNNDVKNNQYITHEKQAYDMEDLAEDMPDWKKFARSICADMSDYYQDDDDEYDDDDYEYDENNDGDGDADVDIEERVVGEQEVHIPVFIPQEVVVMRDDTVKDDDDSNDDGDDDDEEEHTLVLPSQKQLHRYTYMWPILVFLGTALAVLGIVANAILFIIRRRQSITVPRIINVKTVSKLKKNSGLVYQQLSEERDPKTPILSRFALVPTVPPHSNAPENV